MSEENGKQKKISPIIINLICIALFFTPIIYHFLQTQKCLKNMYYLDRACALYASENKEKYPNTLEQLKQNGILKEIHKCPIGKCEYKFISKYIKNKDKEINYFIIYCPKHNFISDSSGLCHGERKKSIKDGKVTDKITLTDEELKQLGLK